MIFHSQCFELVAIFIDTLRLLKIQLYLVMSLILQHMEAVEEAYPAVCEDYKRYSMVEFRSDKTQETM